MHPNATPPARATRVLSPLRDFLRTEAAGGALIALAATAALIWANSPWSDSYADLWHTVATVSIGDHSLALDLRHWLNEGLMTFFFLVVGLEIKRELTDGHLATRRAAALPALGALGGMVMPAAIYLAIAGWSVPRGWAVPMATDIALALGVVALAGARVTRSARAFLLGLAIVDDIGAIVVIAVLYSSGVTVRWLAVAAGALAVAAAMARASIPWVWIAVVPGGVLWLALHEAGVHPTISGVLVGLLASSSARLTAELVDVEALNDLSDVEAVRDTTDIARGTVSTVEWGLHRLHPWVSYGIVPAFALANAGIELSRDGIVDAARSPVAWGIFVALVVGKPVGILGASVIGAKLGVADLPEGSSQRSLVPVAVSAGIGFTVALFVTELAFTDAADAQAAKLAILAASVVMAALSGVMLGAGGRARRRLD